MEPIPPAAPYLPPPAPAGAPPAARPLFWRRVVAALIDGVVVAIPVTAVITAAVIVIVVGSATDSSDTVSVLAVLASFSAVVLVPLAYHTVAVAKFSTTLGKAAAGVDVRRLDGGRPGLGQALGRTLLLSVLGAFALIGLLHGRRDGYHDLVVGTEVVLRPGRGRR